MKRFLELDLLRALAVLCMIFYHAAYDLQMFAGWEIDVLSGWWKVFERVVAGTFLLLVGISFAISSDRTEPKKRPMKYLKRGLSILGCGLLVSIATYIVDPDTFVRFGVLHLIGVSVLILPFFVRLGYLNLLIALFIFCIAPFITHFQVSTNLFLPLGLITSSFTSVDYFPLIPWFAIILIGLVLGQTFYINHMQWRSHLPLPSTLPWTLLWLSRHALLIYLLHQPILLLLIKLVY